MKYIYTLILAIAVSNFASAQGSNDKIFHSTGAAAFTDYAQSPVSTFKYDSYDNAGNPVKATAYSQFEGLSYFTFIYNFRYNLTEMSDNSAVTASLIPAVGVYIATTGSSASGGDAAGFGSFNLPLMLGYEFGAGSTYNSTANIGGFIRFGVEWTKAPLFYDSEDFGSGADVDIKTAWIEPAVQVGIRYWNKKNKLREIAIKYGFGESAPAKDATYIGDETFGSAKTIRLSWMLFLNY